MQAVQSSHALIEFIIKYPGDARQWYTNSNHLCQLSVENEEELKELASKLEQKGLKVVCFYEPDLDNQLTAICIEPSKESKYYVSYLPLMLKKVLKE